MTDWDYIAPQEVEKSFPGHKGRPGHVGGSLPRKGAKAKGAAKREWMRARGRRKEGRSKKWWVKWGEKKGALYNPLAALEAAEANDPSALAVFARSVLVKALRKTEHPILRKRLKKAILKR